MSNENDEDYKESSINNEDDKDDDLNNEESSENQKSEGQESSSTNSNGPNSGNSNSSQSNSYFCGDIPGGFQTLNPEIFDIIGEILGDVVAGRIPFNIQNALGNWIQLVGQVIECYSSQQNYFQSGPGRFYNLKYYNVNNPFCPNDGQQTTNSTGSTSSSGSENQLNELMNVIEELRTEVSGISTRIDKIENNK
ncbi:MAG: hypothetical protein Q4F66_00215 [Clostridium sp.]|nr:hypothetical protein [Clostridium sp.]